MSLIFQLSDFMQQKLLSIIEKSSLTNSQKSRWRTFLGFAGPEVIQDILNVVEVHSGELEFLTKNLEDKIKAIDDPDREKWNRIIKEEGEYLRK